MHGTERVLRCESRNTGTIMHWATYRSRFVIDLRTSINTRSMCICVAIKGWSTQVSTSQRIDASITKELYSDVTVHSGLYHAKYLAFTKAQYCVQKSSSNGLVSVFWSFPLSYLKIYSGITLNFQRTSQSAASAAFTSL